MKLLENKVAVITGAARGIGMAIAKTFAENGAYLALTDVNFDNEAEDFVKEAQGIGVKVKLYKSDASDFNNCNETVAEIAKEFGRIDILVNNAGITRDTLLMRMTEDQWDLVLKINLKSVFNMTKSVLNTMMKQRCGSIINMSSVVGVIGNAGQANYSASKAGMIGFTKSIAKEVGSRNIRLNAIAPGFIETKMTEELPKEARDAWINNIPLRRAGQPVDVANLALFLASDLSSYISGQVISVCGAMTT
ncbi:MAG TPA: 3-oxoacyl-[acyl-carrier-protein] reductase [Bacteroidetes bacterium]|nr:3-oxoacyl-[acyl-carrier-protein] reductase [Bacteroidota bacterium]